MRYALCASAILAGLGVGLGAFGAHALKSMLSPSMLSVWQTAVSYQMWHALGLGLIATSGNTPLACWSGRLMLGGIVLFSGSLYLLALTGFTWFGMLTPFGGLALIAAWLLLAWHAWRKTYA